ncbi:MAG: Flp family type IVb pilin [Burkholderiaceae bacterium]|nr:Flp family type IVb pilin [Burkholderiaceae bacterium]
MGRFIQAAKQFARDEEGVTAVEYGLIAALIVVVIAATVDNIGTRLNTVFGQVLAALNL